MVGPFSVLKYLTFSSTYRSTSDWCKNLL